MARQMGKLVHIDGREHLVSRLESLLEKARDGQIKGIAYTLVNADNSVITGWRLNNRVDASFLAAGVGDLKHRIDTERYANVEEE